MIIFPFCINIVATVLTACGIETIEARVDDIKEELQLQQYLPLAVLKPCRHGNISEA